MTKQRRKTMDREILSHVEEYIDTVQSILNNNNTKVFDTKKFKNIYKFKDIQKGNRDERNTEN